MHVRRGKAQHCALHAGKAEARFIGAAAGRGSGPRLETNERDYGDKQPGRGIKGDEKAKIDEEIKVRRRARRRG